MTATHHCPRCGVDLTPDAPEGLCPSCMMQAALRQGETGFEAESNVAAKTVPSSGHVHLPPSIPRYRIIQLIGTGGMGEVYQAEQRTPVQRMVAIKIIKLGMDSKEVLSRFESEQQALAMLNHPNVAAVFDAGMTDSGRPYFVMEHVSGESITRFCDRHNYNTRQRLELLIQACEAIQHAHQKAIIHRDIKPSNLLVTLANGKPLLKVIDFGVSKALTQRLTERTMFTEVGQLIGTPEYMSPEQAEMSVLDVDTRTDIYSLGVVLYELLSGTLPFDGATLRQAGYSEVQRIIREMDAPRPSTKISTLGERASEIAKHHQMEVRGMRRELKRELEWIPLMAMRKDPARRYRTATELADDIRGYIEHRPLIAGPESAGYRFRKFARRHRVGTAFAALLLIAVVATTFLAIWNRQLYARQKQANEQAVAARDEARLAQSNEASERIHAEREELTAKQQLYAGNINLAHQAWNNADMDRLDELLALLQPREGEADRRGFEWWRLWKMAHAGRILEAPQASPAVHTPAVCSADGNLIAVGRGRCIRIWNANTNAWNEPASLPGEQDSIRCIAMSRDGRYVFAGGRTPDGKGVVCLWDQKTRQSHVLRAFAQPVTAAAFNADGTRLATSCASELELAGSRERNRTAIWDVATLEDPTFLPDAIATVCSLAFSPDGLRLAGAATIEGKVILWDLAANTIKRSPQLANFVSAVAFSSDGKQLAAACGSAEDSGFIRSLDALTLVPDLTMDFTGHTEGITTVAYSADGKYLVTASYDRTARIWDAASGMPLEILRGHHRDVVSACFAASSTTILTRGADDTIRLWERGQHREEVTIPHLRSQVAFSRTGVLAAVNGNSIKLFDASANAIASREMQGYSGETSIAFSDDGQLLAAGNADGYVRIWRAPRWELCCDLPRNNGVRVLRFCPGSNTLAVVDARGKVNLWDVEKSQILPSPADATDVRDVAFSPDGETLALIGAASVRLCQWRTQTLSTPLPEVGGGDCICFSPDGKWLLTSKGRDIFRHDLATGEIISSWAQGRNIKAITVSPDGGRLITATTGGDGCVQLWDLGALNVVATYAGRSSSYVSVEMSSDQTRLAAIRVSSGLSEAVIWEAAAPLETSGKR